MLSTTSPSDTFNFTINLGNHESSSQASYATSLFCATFAFIISISGFFVYAFFVIIVFKRKKFSSSPYFYIAGWLGIADCLSLIVTFSYALPSIILQEKLGRYIFVGGILNIAWFTSLPMIILLAINRYLCICHTELCKKVYTITYSTYYCLACCFCGVAYSFASFFECCPLYFHHEYMSWGWETKKIGPLVLSYGELTIVFLVTIIGFYMNFLVFRALHHSRHTITPFGITMERRRLARERKVFIQFFITTIWLVIFDIPFITLSYVKSPSYMLGYFVTLAYIINCSINGWVYLILNKTIQREVKRWVNETCCASKEDLNNGFENGKGEDNSIRRRTKTKLTRQISLV